MPKKYTQEQKTEAMLILASNKMDYKKTADQTGISVGSLYTWAKNPIDSTVPELIDVALRWLLSFPPMDIHPSDWAVTVGILLDKWMIIKGMDSEDSSMGQGFNPKEYADTSEAVQRWLNENIDFEEDE